MSTWGTFLATAAGLALIGVAARDVFDSLFNPEGRATLSRVIMRTVWHVFRRLAGVRPKVFPLAGPLALVAVLASWAGLLVLGWTLILWPHVPEAFRVDASGERLGGDFVEALNLSLVTITTLGSGDLAPAESWLRIVAPLEALLGFGLLTASVSWLLLIYPVLHRRRSLAYEISLLLQAGRDTGVALERLDPDASKEVYAELTSRLVAVERDIVNFPVSYYFAESDERFSLAFVAPALLELAERGAVEGMPPPVRVRASMLLNAIEDFAATLADLFHGRASPSPAEGLRAYAADHLRGPR
jgi:hypothetical protein